MRSPTPLRVNFMLTIVGFSKLDAADDCSVMAGTTLLYDASGSPFIAQAARQHLLATPSPPTVLPQRPNFGAFRDIKNLQ